MHPYPTELAAWTTDYLKTFEDYQVPESLHLDYKKPPALQKADDIGKDVTAFANSDGGVIIYGIEENRSNNRNTFGKFDPVDALSMPVDRLMNIIDSNSEPRILGVRVFCINCPQLSDDAKPNAVCLVVVIPKSNTVHMAPNGRYYFRCETASKPMRDWQVKDTMNRARHPDVTAEVSMVFWPHHVTQEPESGNIEVRVFNSASGIFCKNFYCRIVFPYKVNGLSQDHFYIKYDGNQRRVVTSKGSGVELYFEGENLYPGSDKDKRFRFTISSSYLAAYQGSPVPQPQEMLENEFLVQIYADGMEAKAEWIDVEKAKALWRQYREIKTDAPAVIRQPHD